MSEAELRGGAPAPTDLGKSLRCCGVCRLVKTFEQFYDAGCENCVFLDMEGDRERVFDCTTTEFKARAGGPASGESGARRLCLPPPPHTHTTNTHATHAGHGGRHRPRHQLERQVAAPAQVCARVLRAVGRGGRTGARAPLPPRPPPPPLTTFALPHTRFLPARPPCRPTCRSTLRTCWTTRASSCGGQADTAASDTHTQHCFASPCCPRSLSPRCQSSVCKSRTHSSSPPIAARPLTLNSHSKLKGWPRPARRAQALPPPAAGRCPVAARGPRHSMAQAKQGRSAAGRSRGHAAGGRRYLV